MGKILEADASVKWYRSPAYYSRAIKGSWQTEGGGALITQAIHCVDVLLSLMGGISELFGYWQLGARHNIESEDVLAAVVKYSSGATGVIQASTAFWPGYTERIEIHGTRGTAIISGDKLTRWDVENDRGSRRPLLTMSTRRPPIRWPPRSRRSNGNFSISARPSEPEEAPIRLAKMATASCR